MTAVPTRIRGVDYPSMGAAARALGVTRGAIWYAMEKGTLDRCGLGAIGIGAAVTGLRKPCWYRGKHYPSRSDAARAHGVSVSAVSRSVAKMHDAARQMAA